MPQANPQTTVPLAIRATNLARAATTTTGEHYPPAELDGVDVRGGGCTNISTRIQTTAKRDMKRTKMQGRLKAVGRAKGG